MSLKKEEILNTIENMSVKDIVDLVSMIEKRFGVTASLVERNVEKDEDKSKEEKTEFKVILKSIGKNKISVIKVVRSILGLGLKEAKDTVDSVPVLIKDSINKIESERLKKLLEDSGATVEIS